MIEEIIFNYLKNKTSAKWYLMRPKTVPGKYGLIEKTGQSKDEHLTTSTFAFQSYAPTLADAAGLSAELKTALEDIVNDVNDISKCSLDSEYNFTNTETKQPRYQAVFTIVHME